jgi:hypothetical protein
MFLFFYMRKDELRAVGRSRRLRRRPRRRRRNWRTFGGDVVSGGGRGRTSRRRWKRRARIARGIASSGWRHAAAVVVIVHRHLLLFFFHRLRVGLLLGDSGERGEPMAGKAGLTASLRNIGRANRGRGAGRAHRCWQRLPRCGR